MPVWWNWQTRWTQNPVVVIPYRFDPDHRHQRKNDRLFTKVMHSMTFFFGRSFFRFFPQSALRWRFAGALRDRLFTKVMHSMTFFFGRSFFRFFPQSALRWRFAGALRDRLFTKVMHSMTFFFGRSFFRFFPKSPSDFLGALCDRFFAKVEP